MRFPRADGSAWDLRRARSARDTARAGDVYASGSGATRSVRPSTDRTRTFRPAGTSPAPAAPSSSSARHTSPRIVTHPLGDLALYVPPGPDAARPEQVAALERALAARDVGHRRVSELPAGEYVVHCGGQRSLVDVLPAILAADPVLGLFPGGADNDFARTFGLDTNPESAATLLASPRVMRVDVGTASCAGYDGPVLNDVVVGLGAAAVRRQSRTRLGRLLGWWRAVATYRARPTDVDMVFAEWHAPATQVRLSNGQFGLGGLHVAPLALPDDGAWDVQVWDGPAHLPFTLQPKMVRGEHVPHEHIAQWRQKRVVVDSAPVAPVAVDGRVVGRTPATFELLPGRLRLKI